MEAQRVMIYCQDSLGLGHLRRNVNIAECISRLDPSTSFLFVADSPIAPFFTLPENSDFLKLPTVVKVGRGDWEVRGLPLLGADRVLDMRAELIRDVALDFEPDVLLVDHMPHGARGELVPALEALREHRPSCRHFLGLRDILGSPEDIVPSWREFGAIELLRDLYDGVLVYGMRELYDLGTAYGLPQDVKDKLHYCGYVVTHAGSPGAETGTTDRLARKFDTPRPQTALVMGGGGSDAHAFMDAMLEAIRLLGNGIPFNTYVITGPFMPASERQKLRERARGLPVVVRRFREDTTQLLQEADVVVSMAGYNTTCEILRYAQRAIVIPRTGPSAEQTLRTGILHDRGLLHQIHPSELSAEILGEVILAQLARPGRRGWTEELDLSGSRNAARLLLDASGSESEGEDRRALAELRVGCHVKVKGTSSAEGFTAYDIVTETEPEETSFEGPIQAFAPEQRMLRLLDKELCVPEGTTIKNLMRDRVPLQELGVGDVVVIKGDYDPERGFEPRKIKREEAYGFAIERVCGRLDALDLDALTLQVAGVRVQLRGDTALRLK